MPHPLKKRIISTKPSTRPVRRLKPLRKPLRKPQNTLRSQVLAPTNQSKLVKKIDKADKTLRFKKRLLKQVFV